MDQDRMVTAGRELVAALGDEGLPIDAAVWVFDADREAWKLWIAPCRDVDIGAFYLDVARAIARDRRRFLGLDVADTEPVRRDHPVIRGMREFADATGEDTFRLTNNMLGGYYLTDGIAVALGASAQASAGLP